MSTEPDQDELKKSWEAYDAFPWEQTLCAHQESFETFTLVQRNNLREELLEAVEGLADRPFKDVNTIFVVLAFGAMRQGARAFASFATPNQDPSRAIPIDFGMLWDAAVATSNPERAEHIGFRAAVEEHPLLDQVLGVEGHAMLATLIGKFEDLAEHEERLKRLLFTNMFHGIRLEYLLRVLGDRVRAERNLVERILDGAPSALLSKSDRATLANRFGLRRTSNPWPRDLVCRCGASLNDALVCCDPSSPIVPESFAAALTEEFLLKRPCCGASLTGFACPACGHVATWTRGIIDSFASPA